MAQLDSTTRYSEESKTPPTQNSPSSPETLKSQTSPTFEQLLQGEATIWPSSPYSPTFGKHQNHEGDHSPLRKSSNVITRVKERAKKMRHNLSNKFIRHGHDHDDSLSCAFTPKWSVNKHVDHPEYLRVPMYELQQAPKNYKDVPMQHFQEVVSPSKKHVLESSVSNEVEIEETFAPKIANLTVETPETTDIKNSSGSTAFSPSSLHRWDKGVSVKEYLIQKFEPGENERTLSKIITDAISPNISPGHHMGMVEKMKEAVSSIFWNEEPSTKTNISLFNIPNYTSANSSSQVSFSTIKTVSALYAKTSTQNQISPTTADTKPSLHIPISTNASEITVKENNGRILQAN